MSSERNQSDSAPRSEKQKTALNDTVLVYNLHCCFNFAIVTYTTVMYYFHRVHTVQTKFSGTNADREILIFPVQLTTCRTGNLTRLIHTLAICVTIHTYIHTYPTVLLSIDSLCTVVHNLIIGLFIEENIG